MHVYVCVRSPCPRPNGERGKVPLARAYGIGIIRGCTDPRISPAVVDDDDVRGKRQRNQLSLALSLLHFRVDRTTSKVRRATHLQSEETECERRLRSFRERFDRSRGRGVIEGIETRRPRFADAALSDSGLRQPQCGRNRARSLTRPPRGSVDFPLDPICPAELGKTDSTRALPALRCRRAGLMD